MPDCLFSNLIENTFVSNYFLNMPTVFLTTERLSTFSQFALFKELVDSTKKRTEKTEEVSMEIQYHQ